MHRPTFAPITRLPRLAPRQRAVVMWCLALVLLLKAAVPLLATAAAHSQGKTLVEVCTVYGVATIEVDSGDTAPAPADHGPGHAAEHCVLAAVLALNAAEPTPSAWPSVQRGQAPPPRASAPTPSPDATAQWVARLKQGPPPAA